jgi:hypothetical protein
MESDINDDSPGLDPAGLYQLWRSLRCNDNVGGLNDLMESRSVDITVGNSGSTIPEKELSRKTDNTRTTNNCHLLSSNRHSVVI